MEAGSLIQEARLRAGLTQAELARRAGTSQSVVARYETGVTSPTIGALRRLLRAADHDLLLSSVPVSGDVSSVDLSSPAGRLLRKHRASIRTQAELLGIRNIRVFGEAVNGARARGTIAAFAGPVPVHPVETAHSGHSAVELLVDFPILKRGLLPLLTLACAVTDLTGLAAEVVTVDLLTSEASAPVIAGAVPL